MIGVQALLNTMAVAVQGQDITLELHLPEAQEAVALLDQPLMVMLELPEPQTLEEEPVDRMVQEGSIAQEPQGDRVL